jgi:hypothetical protein
VAVDTSGAHGFLERLAVGEWMAATAGVMG